MISLNDIKKWYSLDTEERREYYLSRIKVNDNISIGRMEDWLTYMRQYNPNRKKYLYLVTFTKRNPDDNDDIIENYIKTQFKRPPLQVTEAYIAKEKTKEGISHWHVAVETERILKKDRFNYYVKKYGFVDISKSKGTNIETPLNYISKETLPIKII